MAKSNNKGENLKVRLTAQECFRLTMLSNSKGLSKSEYVRRCALNRPISEAHPEVVKALVMVAGEVDLLTKELRAGNFSPAEMITPLSQLVEILRYAKSLEHREAAPESPAEAED